MIIKKVSIFSIFFISLFFGLYFQENSSGGAKIDYEFLQPFIIEFSRDFSSGLDFLSLEVGTFSIFFFRRVGIFSR